MSLVKICLNMIVKNESKIITRLFDSILPIIDYWIISDTGSTDDTVNIIQDYFKEKNILGEIHNHPWKNFGHNRTLALECAQKSQYEFDYILLLDADMKLIIGQNFNKNSLIHDVYNVKQGNENLTYYNLRLLKKKLNAKCVCPTHEYYDICEISYTHSSEIDLYIHDIGDGGAKSDKYSRDIALLKQGIIEDPYNARYHFYLAQSYNCINDFENAIETYQKCVQLNGWSEEIWYSYFQMGKMYNLLNMNDKAIYNYLKAFEINPNRVENIYEIGNLFRLQLNYVLANHFIDLGRSILLNVVSKNNDDKNILFKIPPIYTHLIDYEKTITAYYSGEKDLALFLSNKLILNKKINNMEHCKYSQIMSNLKFYIKKITEYGGVHIKSFANNNNNDNNSDYKSMFNPSIYFYKSQLFVNFRCSNYVVKVVDNNLTYKIHKSGDIIKPTIDDPVSTINYISNLTNNYDINSNNIIPSTYNENENIFLYKSNVVGVEDVRVIEFNNIMYYVGNSRELDCDNVPKMVLGNAQTNFVVQLFGYEDNKCQKNWSPFIYDNKLLLLYSFSPLIILEPNLTTGECCVYKNENQIHYYDMFRGGSQGFYIDDILYFIVHEVAFDNGRLYYHRFVKMTKDLQIDKVSYPFYLQNVGIEYIAGATYDNEKEIVLISWGYNDATAHLSSIDKNNLNILLSL